MKTSRDNSGKLRIAKGDKTGLGGQYAPDVQKLDAAKQQLEELKNTDTYSKIVTLLNGETKKIEFGEEGYVCLLCGEEYLDNAYGYCDETLDCAFDDGEHLILIREA